MSRVGRVPVEIPKGVTVTQTGQALHAKGPKGDVSVLLSDNVKAIIDKSHITVSPIESAPKSIWGTSRSMVQNMVSGVSQGCSKTLNLVGVGYRAKMEGKNLVLNLGFSHPVVIEHREGIKFTIKDQTQLTVEGADRQLVGEIAARIRRFAPGEPYKGKGVMYEGEKIRRKQGKKVQ